MPFELRVVEAALDVVSPLAVHVPARAHSSSEQFSTPAMRSIICTHAICSEWVWKQRQMW